MHCHARQRGRAPGGRAGAAAASCRATWWPTSISVERDILVRALEQHRFNRTAAGASLGLSLRQMRYRMARLGVNVADHVGERGDSAF